jgi:hypothetical protein
LRDPLVRDAVLDHEDAGLEADADSEAWVSGLGGVW